MSYRIVTDSASDLSMKLVEELGIAHAPLSYTMDGETYYDWLDRRDMPIQEFYRHVREGSMPVTAAVNVQQFYDMFEPILQAGEDILYLGFTTGLSTTYQSGEIAAADLREKYPERKILTIDTTCASSGEALIVYLAAQMRLEGKSIEEVHAWVAENGLSVCHWFMVDDLKHLKRGGRVSAATALVGSMLSIKPILHVNEEGKLINMGKARGRAAALQTIMQEMEARAIPGGFDTIFIAHADCLDDAKSFAEQVQQRFQPKRIEIMDMGAVIGSHTGTGALIVSFRGSKR